MEMDRLTPLNLQIPSGRSVPITYLDKKPPKIEVRIQEIFGWRDTPRILNGKLPIQLHLLGPNGRPQQITDDLGNFWATTYQSIKKELKRRYTPEVFHTAGGSTNGDSNQKWTSTPHYRGGKRTPNFQACDTSQPR